MPQKLWAMEACPATVRAKGEDRYLILPTTDNADAEGAMTNAQWRGSALGDAVGSNVGERDGAAVDGSGVVGAEDGAGVGETVGRDVGEMVGRDVGETVGTGVGVP